MKILRISLLLLSQSHRCFRQGTQTHRQNCPKHIEFLVNHLKRKLPNPRHLHLIFSLSFTDMVDFLQFNNDRPEGTQEEAEAGLETFGTALTWTEGLTKQLLELYKMHHKKVGRSIPSLKKLYELLTNLLNAQQKTNLKPSQVEHKMRNLLKGYKAVVDHNSKTGRGSKFFRFETEMENIFGQSKKIHPSILLSERRVVLPDEPVNPAQNSPGTYEPEHREMTPPTDNADLPSTSTIPLTPPRASLHNAPSRSTPSLSILRKSPYSSSRRTRTVRDARLAEIVAMRKERAEFYKQHLEIMRKDAEQREIMTAVMKERNAILQKFLDSFHPDLR